MLRTNLLVQLINLTAQSPVLSQLIYFHCCRSLVKASSGISTSHRNLSHSRILCFLNAVHIQRPSFKGSNDSLNRSVIKSRKSLMHRMTHFVYLIPQWELSQTPDLASGSVISSQHSSIEYWLRYGYFLFFHWNIRHCPFLRLFFELFFYERKLLQSHSSTCTLQLRHLVFPISAFFGKCFRLIVEVTLSLFLLMKCLNW